MALSKDLREFLTLLNSNKVEYLVMALFENAAARLVELVMPPYQSE